MTDVMHFEDLRIGDQWVSRSRTVTETDVVNFAGMTGDYDPLHVDHEYARQTPFRRPIAHGLLGLSFVAGLASQAPAVKTMAFVSIDGWEFLKPIFIGDTLRAVTEVADLKPAGRRAGKVIWSRRLINQDDQIVQAGTFETLVALGSVAMRNKSRKSANSEAFVSKRIAS